MTKACRYDPDLNPTYQEMAMHYGVGVVPARPYKPRDKARVESGVLLAERWIIAALRHRKFFSIEELNQAIRELYESINQRPFRKREGSRASQFAALDKPVVLNPLPVEWFDLSQWSRARVNIDYQIVFDTNYCSVPYNWCRNLWKFVLAPTGVGKSFIACARAQKACRDGYSAFYTRAATMFGDLVLARADGSVRSLLARLSRIDVLLIDDWATAPLAEPERRDFCEICEDRYQIRSLTLTSQLLVARWHEQIGDRTHLLLRPLGE